MMTLTLAQLNSWLPSFLSDHPITAFFLSLPTAAVLVCIAWLTAGTIQSGFSTILSVANLFANALVLSIRGYAPQSIEAAKERDETTQDDEA